jgi:hypothetical protein
MSQELNKLFEKSQMEPGEKQKSRPSMVVVITPICRRLRKSPYDGGIGAGVIIDSALTFCSHTAERRVKESTLKEYIFDNRMKFFSGGRKQIAPSSPC